MIGNIWSIAQESGSDWNSEKLQKYLSGIIFEILRSSSGGCFIVEAISTTSRATDQNSFSIWGAGAQVEHAEAEQVECLLAYLQGVVPAFEQPGLV